MENIPLYAIESFQIVKSELFLMSVIVVLIDDYVDDSVLKTLVSVKTR